MITIAYGSPTSSTETLTVGATAVGITMGVCGARNENGALCQVLDQSIYVSFHGQTVTPTSSDFLVTAGTFFFIAPASQARFIRVTSDARVKVQEME